MPPRGRAPHRRSRYVVLVCALAGAPVPLASPGGAHAAGEPNILVIVTDDQRAGMAAMPFTSRWFRAGTRYTNAFANTPLCCPARASIMTGRYAHNTGVINNQSADNLDHNTTIQKRLRDAGYRTGLVGKFLNRWELRTAPPYFDYWAVFSNRLDGQILPTSGYGYYGDLWNVQGNVVYVERNSTRFIGRKAVQFLNAREAEDDVPWMLFVTPIAPHTPAISEPKYLDAPIARWRGNPATAETDLSDKPPWWQRRSISLRRGRDIRARQFRTLMTVDDVVEQIAKKLGALGESRSTLTFFMSDNGFLWSEHGRRGKTLPYEGSVKVPMFMRWPGHIPAGTVDARLVAHVDVAPTIAAAAGVPPGPAMADGHSLLDPAWSRSRLLLEFFPTSDSLTPGWASTWAGATQYTEYYAADTGEVTFREFYDLVADRWQLNNHYADSRAGNDPSPDDTAAMSATLAQDRVCAGPTCP